MARFCRRSRALAPMQMVAAAFTQEHADGQEAASFVLPVALLQLHRRRLLQACFVSANKL